MGVPMRLVPRITIALLSTVCLSSAWVSASNVRHMTLADLSQASGRIFTGRVIATREGQVSAGGALFTTKTYVFLVESLLKGEFTSRPEQTVEMTLLGTPIGKQDGAGLLFQTVLPRQPKLSMGGRYLIFSSADSAIGLCTTVGLGQGAFRILAQDASELAVNEINNAGLFRDEQGLVELQPGPMALPELLDRVRNYMNKQGVER